MNYVESSMAYLPEVEPHYFKTLSKTFFLNYALVIMTSTLQLTSRNLAYHGSLETFPNIPVIYSKEINFIDKGLSP